MAKVIHCGGKHSNAKIYRLPSSRTVYAFEYVQHGKKCNGCEHEFMSWRGEYPDDEKFTPWYTIPKAEFEIWKRRIQSGEAKPEAQLVSDYTKKIAKDIVSQIDYQTKLCKAHRWYKGQRV